MIYHKGNVIVFPEWLITQETIRCLLSDQSQRKQQPRRKQHAVSCVINHKASNTLFPVWLITQETTRYFLCDYSQRKQRSQRKQHGVSCEINHKRSNTPFPSPVWLSTQETTRCLLLFPVRAITQETTCFFLCDWFLCEYSHGRQRVVSCVIFVCD